MEQSTILEYAREHLSGQIEKLQNNLMYGNPSLYQQKNFEINLEKYKLEYREICKLINDIN